MTHKKTNLFCKLGLATSIVIGTALTFSNCVLSQTIPIGDRTLGSQSSVITPKIENSSSTYQIDGGSIAGSNLFHSFQEFNIGEGKEVYFSNPAGITNIISRVTGSSRSEILGKLGVSGDANLFLINPNGIIFGSNIRLNLKNSFIASTASSLSFADGTQFSATNRQSSPILTVSTPIGLQLGRTPGYILVQESRLDLDANIGLIVKPGKTIGLVGNNITLAGGYIKAPGGRIELGSVGSNSTVSLTPTEKGWTMGYESVRNFQNIQLIAGSFQGFASFVDTQDEINRGGIIQVQGRQVHLADGSQIVTQAAELGGNSIINAFELLRISSGSGLVSDTTTDVNAGNLTINTRQLIVSDGGFIEVQSASQSGAFEPIMLATGRGGHLIVNASEFVELTKGSVLTSGSQGSGDAGNISINTRRLSVRDGAGISTFTRGRGQGGNLIVNASEFVELNNAQLDASSSGVGSAGNLKITTSSLSLTDGAKLTATSELGTGGGNIFLQNLNSLTLERNSEISTSAKLEGNGGNITIETNLLTALENSSITANAVVGRGGNIRINTRGLFISPNSSITATSDEGIDGVVEIERLENDPENALLTLPAEPVNIPGLIAQGCSSDGDSVARRGSEFVITGRGGLPPTPQQAISSDFVLADLGKPIQAETTQAQIIAPNHQNTSESTAIVEAQGWVIDPQGKVILTASAPSVTLSVPWMKSSSCQNNS